VGPFWRGELPLARAFWSWGILGGAVVNLLATLLAAFLLAADLPAWLAALAFASPIPWNLALIVGVWRSAARAAPATQASLAQVAILVWGVALCFL
jgi:hypothetical protein